MEHPPNMVISNTPAGDGLPNAARQRRPLRCTLPGDVTHVGGCGYSERCCTLWEKRERDRDSERGQPHRAGILTVWDAYGTQARERRQRREEAQARASLLAFRAHSPLSMHVCWAHTRSVAHASVLVGYPRFTAGRRRISQARSRGSPVCRGLQVLQARGGLAVLPSWDGEQQLG